MTTLSSFFRGVLFLVFCFGQRPSLAFERADEMSLDAKVGQLFMLGIPDDGESISDYTRTLIKTIKPGGIILFKRNIKSLRQVSKLNEDLQRYSVSQNGIPLLIALDQEGGRVVRVKTNPALPSALAVGSTRDPEIAYQIALASGKILRGLGFSMNLAPVLDTIPQSNTSFIGERAFGSDPTLVAQMGLASAQGMLAARVLPTAKHFPGSGHITGDPHETTVSTAEKNIGSVQTALRAFKEFGSLFPSALMLSHVSYPQFDSSAAPATFSKKIIQNILRDSFEYKGLVLTDDLQMGGAKIYPDMGSAALASLNAGSDMLMITWSKNRQSSAYQAVIEAAKSKQFARILLDSKVNRTLKIKRILQPSLSRQHPLSEEDSVFDKKLLELDHKVLSINLSREVKKVTNLYSDSPIVLVSSNQQLRWQFERGLNRPSLQLDLSANTYQKATRRLSEFIHQNERALVFVPTAGGFSLAWLRSLPQSLRSNIIPINLGAPGLRGLELYHSVLEINHYHRDLGKKLAELLSQSNNQVAIAE